MDRRIGIINPCFHLVSMKVQYITKMQGTQGGGGQSGGTIGKAILFKCEEKIMQRRGARKGQDDSGQEHTKEQ